MGNIAGEGDDGTRRRRLGVGGGWLTRFAISRLHRVLRALEPVGILLAVLALILDIQSRQEGRVVAAWQLLSTPAPGNSGKVQALEYLANREGVPLVGIDLGRRENQEGVFLEAVDLRRAVLTNANFTGAKLSRANFAGAELSGAKLRNLGEVVGIDFEGATMAGADVSDSRFVDASFERQGGGLLPRLGAGNTVFLDADFTDTRLILSGSNVDIFDSNVSGACIVWDGENTAQHPEGLVWALQANPARGLPASIRYVECAREPDRLGIGSRNTTGCTPRETPVPPPNC